MINKLSMRNYALSHGLLGALLFLFWGIMHNVFEIGSPLVDFLTTVLIGFDNSLPGLFVGIVWGFLIGVVYGGLISIFYNKLL